MSFDFDLTLTKEHTYNELGLKDEKESTVAKAGSGCVNLIDSRLLADLIAFICGKNRMLFAITTMQSGYIVQAAIKCDPRLAPVFELYIGSRLFIIDRKAVQRHGNKANALEALFGVRENANGIHSGVHFDDCRNDEPKFEIKNMGFCHMVPRCGFGTSMTSSLCRGIARLPRAFNRVGVVPDVPTYASSMYANVEGFAVPFGVEFELGMIRSHSKGLSGFISDLMLVIASAKVSERGQISKR
ncbi:hypothetical protein F9L16_17690 [Agarivorans sp. B2Z047]|uniref:hypothetical protein n=1 Tax=Agarivorans sp. B2Z047 TaxID=2652721 RepID=UPI00128CDDDE|nr:hypothetical protein [Agarivorans sp. B2Z047]MPW30821.1 hypothetical protein [Agarivorans sp. B2Z047]UQN40948.1 hypothetical protein LQZ07_14315 [Agarivorans sp. B2Z047]